MALGGLADFASNVTHPTVRLGVTGLSRAGKTVFITAFIHALLSSSKLPLFEAKARGRIARVYLEPQPDDDLPRFAYEDHMARLTGSDRDWPESTSRISQIRLTIEYEPHGIIASNLHGGKLHIDIIDYPGEWLLDLALMSQSFQQWSAATINASRLAPRQAQAGEWHAHLSTLDPNAVANETDAVMAATLFTNYLAGCRQDGIFMSTLPPGRFLRPGDLAGSPLLTFAPLDIAPEAVITGGSLANLMQRRYDAYVKKVVKPFFYGHFARLDRQIVLVDALAALNAGASSVEDLRQALTGVLGCFRLGANSLVSELFGKRVDRIFFAATKADQLHHTSHDRLEDILRILINEAAARAEHTGATCHVAAVASVRATREATVTTKDGELPCIVGIPQAGESIAANTFDGIKEAAVFPGDLPSDPQRALSGGMEGAMHFVRFRPPLKSADALPHIRLDRALEFLLGDRFA